jgi:putative flippase GtrA
LHNGFSDAQCGFKALRAEVARDLMPLVEDEAWFFDTELLVLAERSGLRIHEVPVDWVDDPDSRVDVVSTAKADLMGVLRMVLHPRRATLTETRRGSAPDDAQVDGALSGQLARFVSIGIVSTVVFAALFVLLERPLGSVGADVVALLVCSIANTAANRRLTFALRGRAGRSRHYRIGIALGLVPLVLTLLSLAVLDAAGVASLAAIAAALTAASAAGALVRFVLLRSWAFGDRR